MRVGDTFHHYNLGEVQLRRIISGTRYVVCTTDVKRGNRNIFVLEVPEHPSRWRARIPRADEEQGV